MAWRSEDERQPELQPIRVAYHTGHRATHPKLAANGRERMQEKIGSGLALLRVEPDPWCLHAGPQRAEHDLIGTRVQISATPLHNYNSVFPNYQRVECR